MRGTGVPSPLPPAQEAKAIVEGTVLSCKPSVQTRKTQQVETNEKNPVHMYRYMPKGVSYIGICICLCICTICSISFELFVAFRKSRQPGRTLCQDAGCDNCLSRWHLHPIFIFFRKIGWNREMHVVKEKQSMDCKGWSVDPKEW